jgi:hypothetical protein
VKSRFLKIRTGPSGIQFFNRGTGFAVLLDEAHVAPRQWSQAPRHVSIALTNACDLYCRHCFVEKSSAFLDPALVAGWLLELDRNGCLSVGFGGGEPTLHPDFADLCRFAAKKTDIGITCTTHGHGFHNALLASVVDNLHFIRISMDGVGATYEIIRGRPFQSLCSRIREIGALSRFGINYLVNSMTLPDLDNAVLISAKLGASQFLLLPEQPVNGQGGIDLQTALALRTWVSSYRGSMPLSVSELGSDGLPTCLPLPAEGGLRAYTHIDANGILKASSFDATGVVIGRQGFMQALTKLSHKGGFKDESLE